MKKLDKLIIISFVGPFLLTFVIVVFILLTQYMLKYFDDFVGKGLGMDVFAELIFYFSINMTSNATPLAILLASLMTFGNLGEHFELTAIKGAGISLTRALLPLFFFAIILSVLSFLSNNYIVPRANLKAYSLLYDIKEKKPALDIQEGVFYGGIPKFKIKVNNKHSDGETIEDVIIYDHSNGQGNQDVIIANSGKMYTFDNERYLRLELFNGNRYSESQINGNRTVSDKEQFVRTNFDTTKMTFSLASFGLQRTKEEYFSSHRRMKTLEQLNESIDSMQREELTVKYDAFNSSNHFYQYHLRHDSLMPAGLETQMAAITARRTAIYDSLEEYDSLRYDMPYDSLQDLASSAQRSLARPARPTFDSTTARNLRKFARIATKDTPLTSMPQEEIATTDVAPTETLDTGASPVAEPQEGPTVAQVDTLLIRRVDEALSSTEYSSAVAKALTQSRTVKNALQINADKLQRLEGDIGKDVYEGNRKIAQACSCLIMFLIGAPLGAIIKKGGLGLPVLISICFFIAFYVISEISRKWAEELVINPYLAVWVPNLVLLPFGIVFLIQARLDTRLLESDFYQVLVSQIRNKIKMLRGKKTPEQKRVTVG